MGKHNLLPEWSVRIRARCRFLCIPIPVRLCTFVYILFCVLLSPSYLLLPRLCPLLHIPFAFSSLSSSSFSLASPLASHISAHFLLVRFILLRRLYPLFVPLLYLFCTLTCPIPGPHLIRSPRLLLVHSASSSTSASASQRLGRLLFPTLRRRLGPFLCPPSTVSATFPSTTEEGQRLDTYTKCESVSIVRSRNRFHDARHIIDWVFVACDYVTGAFCDRSLEPPIFGRQGSLRLITLGPAVFYFASLWKHPLLSSDIEITHEECGRPAVM